jgi:hypothetical protein
LCSRNSRIWLHDAYCRDVEFQTGLGWFWARMVNTYGSGVEKKCNLSHFLASRFAATASDVLSSCRDEGFFVLWPMNCQPLTALCCPRTRCKSLLWVSLVLSAGDVHTLSHLVSTCSVDACLHLSGWLRMIVPAIDALSVEIWGGTNAGANPAARPRPWMDQMNSADTSHYRGTLRLLISVNSQILFFF